MKDFYNNASDFYQPMQLAFVIKSHMPYACKVILLHQKYGKVICVFAKTDQASLLTAGSLIWCSLQKKNNLFIVHNIEIETNVSVQHLLFVHEIMKLCLHRLPLKIAAPELFDFLLYVHGYLHKLCAKGQKIVMLRIFLMLDLLDHDSVMYQAAILDPMGTIEHEICTLEKYVTIGWNNFYKIPKTFSLN